MPISFFDIHSHLDFKDYDADREEVINRMSESGAATIVVGVDERTSKRAVELAEKNKNIHACVGIHPNDSKETFNEPYFEELLKYKKVVAIGECGLDYSRIKNKETNEQNFEKNRQKELFIKQISFALKHNKPLMLHCRDAYDDVLSILHSFLKTAKSKLRGNVHFFAGDLKQAQKFFDLGFCVSFTGVITFSRDYDEAIKNAPLGMIMSETDSPFVAPMPYRGKRNEPSYVIEVVKKIAEVRGEDIEFIKKKLVENALRVFNIKI